VESALIDFGWIGFATGTSLPPDVVKSRAHSAFTLRLENRFDNGAVVLGSPGRLSVYSEMPKFAKSGPKLWPVACSMSAAPFVVVFNSLACIGVRVGGSVEVLGVDESGDVALRRALRGW